MSETAVSGSGARRASRPITPREFERIRRLAYDKFGLDLKNGKQELVSARLGKKIREGNFRSFEEYYQHVVSDETGEALVSMIDALTTNFTSFLREPVHFEFLAKKVLPGLRNRDYVNIWSAACSTGEEAYTLAFSLVDGLAMAAHLKIHILATDISTKALETARRAIYPAERFVGFPPTWLPKFLLRGHGRWEGWYRVKPEVSRLIEFHRLNLIEPFSHPNPFAFIFCRNVMIYFDKPTQEMLVNRLTQWLEPGGYLFIGHSESLTAVRHTLHYVQPAIYQRSADRPSDHGRSGMCR